MSGIDLHIHSNYSDDGELSPKDIISKSKELGLTLIAITDHNSVKGISEAILEAKDIRVIPGIELDCTYKGRGFHLLGYDFDYTITKFREIEEDILRQEKEAAEKKVSLFSKATGIALDIETVLAAAEDGVVTGELIAELLFKREDAYKYEMLKPYLPRGEKSDMPNVRFYWDYFSEGKVAYVPIHYITMEEGIELIHSAGGVAVLAHPGQNLKDKEELFFEILNQKIDGIEVFSSYHNEEKTSYYLNAALKYKKIATCGSDFHGKHKPNIPLGGHKALWKDEEIRKQLSW